MKSVFVDSGGFFALLAPEDKLHPRAQAVCRHGKCRGFGTENVVCYKTRAKTRILDCWAKIIGMTLAVGQMVGFGESSPVMMEE